MTMKNKDFGIAIFPFLKTSGPVRIGKYKFRCTADLDGLPNNQAKAVAELASMLYLRDDIKIASAAYSITEALGSWRPGPVVKDLERVRAVVGYLYSAPHPTSGDVFLPFDNASLAILNVSEVSVHLLRPKHGTTIDTELSSNELDSLRTLPGYEGIFNFRQPMWLAVGSRIYGPKLNMILNISQDLAVQLRDPEAFRRADSYLLLNLLEAPASSFKERVFTALGWYNSANLDHEDSDKSLLSLAIAFETLLKLPVNQKTERLVDSISLLLGRTERLAEWAVQFYAARSEVAHEGRVRDWRFYTQPPAKKPDTMHSAGEIMTYGRQIFQLCLTTVLTGASLAEQAGLKERFVANSERYAAIATTLSTLAGAPDVRLLAIEPIVDGLSRYQFVSSATLITEDVLAAVRIAIKTLLKCDLNIGGQLKLAFDDFVKVPHKDIFSNLKALSDVNDALIDFDYQMTGRVVVNVVSLISTAWKDLFGVYYHLVDEQRRMEHPEAENS